MSIVIFQSFRRHSSLHCPWMTCATIVPSRRSLSSYRKAMKPTNIPNSHWAPPNRVNRRRPTFRNLRPIGCWKSVSTSTSTIQHSWIYCKQFGREWIRSPIPKFRWQFWMRRWMLVECDQLRWQRTQVCRQTNATKWHGFCRQCKRFSCLRCFLDVLHVHSNRYGWYGRHQYERHHRDLHRYIKQRKRESELRINWCRQTIGDESMLAHLDQKSRQSTILSCFPWPARFRLVRRTSWRLHHMDVPVSNHVQHERI